MTFDDLNNPEQWAQQPFGSTELGDIRRTNRAIKLGTALASNPNASLPNQFHTWHDLKAACRLLANDGLNFPNVECLSRTR